MRSERFVARLRRLATLSLAAVLLVAFATSARADDVLVLKDGRKIPVTRLARRDGQVVFQTTRGETFSVPEDQVVSPPLESIPAYPGQVLVLKDGRKIPVTRLARRGGLVLFETARGERFSVSEDQVISPPLDSIPAVEGPPPPVPPAPETKPETPPAVEPTTPAPPAPPRPAPPETPGVPEFIPLPDRWSIQLPDDPRIVKGRLIDPYNQNVLKGDKPVIGNTVFLVLTGVLDSGPNELRRLPVGSGVSTADPSRLEFFGDGKQFFTTPRIFVSAELFQGQTAFKPKTWAVKATGAFNLNYLKTQENNIVNIDPREGKTRRREDGALEEAFGELKLATVSRNYDFVSVRAGIQPFVSDFRGFIFNDSNLGARLFGNFANNRWQYNAAYFDLLEKETNSELNTFDKREQKVAIANVFRQDFLTKGYTISLSYHWSKDDASVHYDANDFLVRPAKIGSVRPHEVKPQYVGWTGDGHIGRLNVSHALYYAFGEDTDHPLADRKVDISAQLAAVELSIDKDWARFKVSGFFASGDDEATDDKAKGFDSIYDNSNFAGGPFSFWSRSGIALTQTGVLLKTPGSLLPDLRSNKFEGQANFVNPGILLVNAAADLELTPKLKAVLNANYLRFHKTGALSYLLFQPGIRKDIGIDVGAGVLWRPLLNENVVITAGVTGLFSGKGFDDIYSSICGVPGCGASPKNLWNTFVQLKLTY
jgi:hypothetical protein